MIQQPKQFSLPIVLLGMLLIFGTPIFFLFGLDLLGLPVGYTLETYAGISILLFVLGVACRMVK